MNYYKCLTYNLLFLLEMREDWHQNLSGASLKKKCSSGASFKKMFKMIRGLFLKWRSSKCKTKNVIFHVKL